MADDTMEISSEHGHNIGDEDIDIDIDFTAGHVDEDYVLEDAASNVGFGEEFQTQPFPAMGHDDLMIDEDDESYAMPMDGEDFIQDEDSQNMEHEPLDVSLTPADIPTLLVDGHALDDGTYVVADGEMKEPEVTWETNDEPEQESHQADVHFEDPEEEHHEDQEAEIDLEDSAEVHLERHEEHGDGQDSTKTQVTEAPATSTTGEDPHPYKPHNMSPKGIAAGLEPRSPSTPALKSPDHGPDNSDDPLGTFSVSQDVISTIESATAEEVSTPSSQEVMVAYRDAKYSLFSKSEADDIDSYFLSDLAIKDKPLVDFFVAIRDVIHDDLSDEDELCLSVEDLGLEVEEMSSLTGSVTIGQIISLREKLLQNDGVEPIGPLCLALVTRPSFSSRFANLISGASEGKGLSQLVRWEDSSESFDESAHVTNDEHGEEFGAGSYQEDEIAEEQESDLPQQDGSDDTLGHEPAAKQEPLEEATDTQSVESSEISAINGTHAILGSAAQPPHTENISPSHKIETSSNGEYDEDGDLIDYSEEEDEAPSELRKDAKSHSTQRQTDENRTNNGTFTDFIPPCLKPNACFCSKCNDLLSAEYEAINEELRRRSISRSAEDDLLEQAAEANEGEDHDHETKLETGNGIEYDENDGDEFQRTNRNAEHGDQSANFDEDGAAAFVKHENENEFFIEGGDPESGEILEGLEPTSESLLEAGQENFDEFDFGENDNTQEQGQLPRFAGQETASLHDHNKDPANRQAAALTQEILSVSSTLGFADAADSESAASERTLEAQPVSIDDLQTDRNEDNEDEIDYDDDEELDTIEVQEPTVKVLQSPSSGSGKRQRTDDDGLSTGSKEAKRPRS